MSSLILIVASIISFPVGLYVALNTNKQYKNCQFYWEYIVFETLLFSLSLFSILVFTTLYFIQ